MSGLCNEKCRGLLRNEGVRAQHTPLPGGGPARDGGSMAEEGPVMVGAAPLRVRCGLNAREPIEEEGDLFGATVILAARIAAKAEGGEQSRWEEA